VAFFCSHTARWVSTGQEDNMNTQTDILTASLPDDFFDDALTARDLISRLIAEALAAPVSVDDALSLDADTWMDPQFFF
jgi:hypothetical protein